jgi:hypothetical protein
MGLPLPDMTYRGPPRRVVWDVLLFWSGVLVASLVFWLGFAVALVYYLLR